MDEEKAYERLVEKLTKENLWLYILSLLRDKPMYGYEIRDEIERRFGFRPGMITSYRVLYSLRKGNYVVIKGMEPSSTGPSRKYYAITEKGEALLKKADIFIRALQTKLFK